MDSNSTLVEFCNDHWFKVKTLAYNTRRTYRYFAHLFERWHLKKTGRPATLGSLTPESTQQFEDDTSGILTEKKTRQARVVIRSLWAMSAKEGWSGPCPPNSTEQGLGTSRIRNLLELPVEGKQTLWQAYRDHYYPHKVLNRTACTKKHYLLTMRAFTRHLGRTPTTADLNDITVAEWLHALRDNGLSCPTVNQRRDYILAFWRFLARKRIVEQCPDVEKLPEPEIIPVAWTKPQLERLFKSCSQEPGKIDGIPAGEWWLAMHHILWDTGERIGAVLALKWDWLDLDTGDLIVPGDVRKGGKKSMYYQLTPTAIKSLKEIQSPERKLLFPFPYHESTFYNHYSRILKRAGLPTGRNRKPHCIRRSFASHLEAAGGNATEALAHSSRKVTEAYLDPRLIKKPAPNKLLFEINPGGNGGGK